jgi:sulfur-oxidizing protein SoxY
MIDAKRRVLLKGSLGVGAIGVAVSAGLLTPSVVLAEWPANAFKATDTKAALTDLLGSDATETSDKVTVKAPDIAENGAVVPVTVESSLPGVDSITIMSASNVNPMAASFSLAAGTAAYVSTRIKMAKTSDVVAVVKSGGKLYKAAKNVKVTIGGCGG